MADPAGRPEPVDEWREALGARLKRAMVRRDVVRIATLRSLMAALDNAGAAGPGQSGHAGAETVSEVPRRVLGQVDIQEIIDREVSERRDAMAEYQRTGALLAAARLRAELAIIAEAMAEEDRGDAVRREDVTTKPTKLTK